MNLNHLAIFHAVAEEASVSRGAIRLHISQPAVSRQLAEFERALGTALFDRLPKGVRLTEAEQLLNDYARRLFAIEKEAERSLRELQGLERGRLAIGASTSIGTYLLPPVLAAFHRAYPSVEIRLEISNTDAIQRALENGALDLGFTEGLPPRVGAVVFREDELVAIAAPDHPFSFSNAPVTLEQLCAEPFVIREAGSGTREVVEEALRLRGLRVNTALTLGNTEAIKRAVMEAMGVAIVSRLTIQTEISDRRLVIVPVADFTLRRPLHQLQVPGRHASPSVRAFLETLKMSAG